ncbi:MAG: arabinofuranosyltransferase [candidate division Zixibacteria bacterium]|nr:arabinofuranosyltransferase [candidate division Zixibacteria bacterium]
MTARHIPIAVLLVAYLVVGAYFIDCGGGYYDHDSIEKSRDLVMAKIWLMLSIASVVLLGYSDISRNWKLWSWIGTLSVYFVVTYALLYKGTDFGYGGQWGDNGNRLALVTKFRDFSSIFQDWYFKDLPSFYPPLWFYVSGKLAWLFDFEGYKTIKYGYFVIYALWPAALFICWKRVANSLVALVVVVLTIFMKDLYFDFVYYEYIAASFFIPWWLYFVEDVKRVRNKDRLWYAAAGLSGALIFMTFYYWFFIGIMAVIIRPLVILLTRGKASFQSPGLGHMLAVAVIVAVFSAVYWLPLLVSIIQHGAVSMQNRWFSFSYISFSNPYFAASLGSLINLIGLGYLGARNCNRAAAGMILLLLGILSLYLVERICNLNGLSIQTRKLTGLMSVFLAVPSGYGLVFLVRLINRRIPSFGKILIAVGVLALLYIGNGHSEIRGDRNYQWGINDFVREHELDVFRSVDYKGSVFLTNRYVEAVYLPYYLFVCPNGATAHASAQYDQRIAFLKYLSTIDSEEQVALLLKQNRFDRIDYFFFPADDSNQVTYYDMYPLYFPGENIKLRIEFPYTTTVQSRYFERKHDKGMFAVHAPAGSVIEIFVQEYDTSSFIATSSEFNRLQLAIGFLDSNKSDSLLPFLDEVRQNLETWIELRPICEFGEDIELAALKILPSEESGRQQLLVALRIGKRLAKDYNCFVHAFSETNQDGSNSKAMSEMINLDIHPARSTSQAIIGEYLFCQRDISLEPGAYTLHVGMFNKDGRLKTTFRSEGLVVPSSPLGL